MNKIAGPNLSSITFNKSNQTNTQPSQKKRNEELLEKYLKNALKDKEHKQKLWKTGII